MSAGEGAPAGAALPAGLPEGLRPTPDDALRRARLVAMQRVATGLLLVAAAAYALALWGEPRWPWLAWVRAFSEAAMVGGIADWFAVTALFRHPLGLPIPHTAIVPRNKERIAAALANFLRDNFLVPSVVARRMRKLDVASALGKWLANPESGDGRLRRGALRLAADLLDSLDQERLGGMVKGAIGSRLRDLDMGPLAGQALQSAIAEDRHVPLLDSAIRFTARMIATNEAMIRTMVHQRAGSIMRWTGLDETLANAIIDGLYKLVADMADDRGHPLRLKIEDALKRLSFDLQFDPEMHAKVDRLRDDLLENPALHRWLDGLWESSRAALLRFARDPEAFSTGRVSDALRQLGQTLQSDPELAATINRFARRTAVGAAADYGDGIVRLVSDTIRGWDARTLTGRLENAVGRDLQYIRINGTLVGGLVGVAIHAADAWLWSTGFTT